MTGKITWGGGTCLNAPGSLLMAFTLAEVLITLAIIGVVAAITLPNLIANHQKKVLAGQAKHAYSLLSQGYTSALAKHEDPIFWEANVNVENERSIFEKYLFPELKGQNSGNRVPKDKVLYQKCDAYLQNFKTMFMYSNKMDSFQRCGCIVLASGELIFPDTEVTGFGQEYRLSSVMVDVNGFKKPNKIGKDLFIFYIVTQPINREIYLGAQNANIANFHYKGIFPAGYDGKGRGYSCSVLKKELSPECTAKLMKDGWEFKDDYPW